VVACLYVVLVVCVHVCGEASCRVSCVMLCAGCWVSRHAAMSSVGSGETARFHGSVPSHKIEFAVQAQAQIQHKDNYVIRRL